MKKVKMNKKILKNLYVNFNFSTKALAELFNCSQRTIQRRLNELGIDLLKGTGRDKFGRLHSEHRKLRPMNGEFNGNYNGGISIYRKIAFENGIDEICYHCNTTEDIIIHHIDHNRYNNNPSNLRPCCRRCHIVIEHPETLEKAWKARKEKAEMRRKLKELEKEEV